MNELYEDREKEVISCSSRLEDVGCRFCVQQSWGVPADRLGRIHLAKVSAIGARSKLACLIVNQEKQ